MTSDGDCDVCEGLKFYPIHNRFGRELYSIQCPECFGSGNADDPNEPEPEFEYPASTAAKMKTADDLREWMARERGGDAP